MPAPRFVMPSCKEINELKTSDDIDRLMARCTHIANSLEEASVGKPVMLLAEAGYIAATVEQWHFQHLCGDATPDVGLPAVQMIVARLMRKLHRCLGDMKRGIVMPGAASVGIGAVCYNQLPDVKPTGSKS